MKYLAILQFSFCLLIGISCSPGGSAAKGIKGIIKRSDCKGPCHKTMECEGKVLTLEMQLANNNIMTSGNTIFARDPDNYDYTIKIEFGESVPIELYGDIKNPINKRFIVTGVVEGYDQYVHEQCTRSYILKVTNPKDFKVFDH
ncbi:MAG: hypothetical protein IPI45_05710 [Saprospiraceae bacterium]|nr:hypothetical protein [Saprospiraceae bacterium]MBK7737255.1 hypothetical protein [Saprospiraceae bacterium]MBK7914151.1 hypothetical protein [Saprospiraceae bacterium]